MSQPSCHARPAGSGAQQTRPPWLLAVIVLSQLAATSVWFAGNAALTRGVPALGSAAAMTGWITMAVQLGFIGGTLLFAFLSIADRFSPRRLFLLSTLAAALFNLLTIWAAGPLAWLLLRLAVGFFIAGIYPIGMRIAAGWYDRRLGNALGFLIGALVLGTAFPHLIQGSTPALSWQALMTTTSAVCLAGGLLMFRLVPDGPYLTAGAPFDPKAVIDLFRHRRLRSAALGYFGHMWELYALWAFTPLFVEAYGQASGFGIDVSLTTFGVIAIGFLGCVIGGRVSLQIGSARVAAGLLSASGLCCLLSPLLFGAPPWLFLFFMLVWGVAVVGDSPQFSTIVAHSAPPSRVGSALTVVNSIGFGITVISLALLQWLAQTVAPQYLLLPLAIGPFVGLWGLRPLLGRVR